MRTWISVSLWILVSPKLVTSTVNTRWQTSWQAPFKWAENKHHFCRHPHHPHHRSLRITLQEGEVYRTLPLHAPLFLLWMTSSRPPLVLLSPWVMRIQKAIHTACHSDTRLSSLSWLDVMTLKLLWIQLKSRNIPGWKREKLPGNSPIKKVSYDMMLTTRHTSITTLI